MTYVTSDIHGHYDKYRALLEKIHLASADTLYILGDVIDRGQNGVKILQDMMERSNVIPILGNHEYNAAACLPWLMEEITDQSLKSLGEDQIAALSDWIANGGLSTLRELKGVTQQERENILEYLQEMYLYEEITVEGKSFVLVHAGLDNFSPNKPLEEYELTDFLFGRPSVDTAYYPDKTVVFGHTPTRLLSGQDRIFMNGTYIDIDCGCAFDGPLGCLCLETMEEIYV